MGSRCEPFSGVGGLLLLSWEIGAEGGSRTRRPCLEPPPSDTGTVTSVGSDPLFPHKGHHHHQRKRRVCGASRKQLAYLRNFQVFSFHVCPFVFLVKRRDPREGTRHFAVRAEGK
jgi:hypothetical protein